MLSTQTKSGVGTGVPKYTSAMVDNKTATDKQHWACEAETSGVWENIFTYFVSQPVENTTLWSLFPRAACWGLLF